MNEYQLEEISREPYTRAGAVAKLWSDLIFVSKNLAQVSWVEAFRVIARCFSSSTS